MLFFQHRTKRILKSVNISIETFQNSFTVLIDDFNRIDSANLCCFSIYFIQKLHDLLFVRNGAIQSTDFFSLIKNADKFINGI